MSIKPFSKIVSDEKEVEQKDILKPFADEAIGGTEIEVSLKDNSSEEHISIIKKSIDFLGSLQGLLSVVAVFILVAVVIDTIQTLQTLSLSSSILDLVYLIVLIALGTTLSIVTYRNYIQIKGLKNVKRIQELFARQKINPDDKRIYIFMMPDVLYTRLFARTIYNKVNDYFGQNFMNFNISEFSESVLSEKKPEVTDIFSQTRNRGFIPLSTTDAHFIMFMNLFSRVNGKSVPDSYAWYEALFLALALQKYFGGKYVIKIFDKELASDKTFYNVLILFSSMLRYYRSIQKNLRRIVKELRINESVALQLDESEADLYLNPRKMNY